MLRSSEDQVYGIRNVVGQEKEAIPAANSEADKKHGKASNCDRQHHRQVKIHYRWCNGDATRRTNPRQTTNGKNVEYIATYNVTNGNIALTANACHHRGRDRGENARAGAVAHGERGEVEQHAAHVLDGEAHGGEPCRIHLHAHAALLLAADEDMAMPPKKEGALEKSQIEVIKTWIEQGAEWPDGVVLEQTQEDPRPIEN